MFAGALLMVAPAEAQEPEGASSPPADPAPGGGQASAEADASISTEDLGESNGDDDSGAVLLAGKIGGIASFNGLSPFLTGGIEAGYAFPGRNIALLLDVTYTAPKSDDAVGDPRVPDGEYDWELRQKVLTFQPTFLYRFTGLSDMLTPYAGIGPRIYFIEDVTRGSATDPTTGKQTFKDSFERSTKFGFGIPLGLELALGPGGLFAEFLFQWGPLGHETTGDTHLGSGSLFLGYRALL
jgi:opacity protein-like surface antigen